MRFIILTLMAGIAMVSCDIADIYSLKNNLTQIRWAHAVNNVTFLQNTLKDDKVHMIEADVSLGQVNGTGEHIPIMAHQPLNTSDLSLEDFIIHVSKYNEKNTKKGIILDFKSTEAWNKSIEVIKMKYGTANYPLWINADIVQGPIDAAEPSVKADTFLNGVKDFANVTLSVGWTTKSSKTPSNYTDNQIDDMLGLIKNINQTVTFPVRAVYAANSLSQMRNLTKTINGSTLTIWHGIGDVVDTEKLSNVILDIGIEKVYVDVPDEIYSKLKLYNTGNKFGLGLITLIISLFTTLVGTKIF